MKTYVTLSRQHHLWQRQSVATCGKYSTCLQCCAALPLLAVSRQWLWKCTAIHLCVHKEENITHSALHSCINDLFIKMMHTLQSHFHPKRIEVGCFYIWCRDHIYKYCKITGSTLVVKLTEFNHSIKAKCSTHFCFSSSKNIAHSFCLLNIWDHHMTIKQINHFCLIFFQQPDM